MSKADDELFGLKSSRTGEYLHSKSADEMFEELNYRKNKNNKIINIIKYINDRENVEITFDTSEKLIAVSDKGNNYNWFNVDELQAINEKVKELKWE